MTAPDAYHAQAAWRGMRKDRSTPCRPERGPVGAGASARPRPSVTSPVPLLRGFGGVVLIGRRHHHGVGDHAGLLAHPGLDRVGHVRVIPQELLGVLPALADALAVIAEPGARLLDDTGLHAEIEQLADLADALAIHDVELDLAERRRELVLRHLHPGLVADGLVAVLDAADPPDLHADRGVELQRVAARGGLRV